MITLKNILVPTDCSELSVEAANYAVKFAMQFNASLTLLLVTATEPLAVLNDYGYFSPELHQKLVLESTKRAEAELQSFWESVAVPEVRAKLVNAKGDPFTEIVRYAKENEIDIIIMGTHGHTGIKHILMGSVAEKVVRYSPYPVLTVKHSGYTFDVDLAGLTG
jgi:nucleotide-binding universal stress UspA family protein